MKIFLSFLQGKPDHPIPAYSFWEYYVKNGIEEAGHSWTECHQVDWAEGLVYQEGSLELARWKTTTWAKTLDYIKKNRPSFFLSYLYPKQIDISAIEEIKKLGIPCVNFFCDHIREFKTLPREFHVFDLNWVPEVEALKLYKKNNLKHVHLPMPMWVAPELRTKKYKFNSDITFIGSRDIQRTLLFNELLKTLKTVNIKIYGKGWLKEDLHINKFIEKRGLDKKIKTQVQSLLKNGLKSYLRSLSQRNLDIPLSAEVQKSIYGTVQFNEYVNITKSSYITLGINRYPNFDYPLHKPHTYSRLRDIEAPMLGACYLTEKAKDLKYFYPNNEILTYGSIDELSERISQIKSFSMNERVSYIQKIQTTAINELSIPNSLTKLRDYLFK